MGELLYFNQGLQGGEKKELAKLKVLELGFLQTIRIRLLSDSFCRTKMDQYYSEIVRCDETISLDSVVSYDGEHTIYQVQGECFSGRFPQRAKS